MSGELPFRVVDGADVNGQGTSPLAACVSAIQAHAGGGYSSVTYIASDDGACVFSLIAPGATVAQVVTKETRQGCDPVSQAVDAMAWASTPHLLQALLVVAAVVMFTFGYRSGDKV
jgi:hypothetical protein